MDAYWMKSGNKELGKYSYIFLYRNKSNFPYSRIVNQRLDDELDNYFAKAESNAAAEEAEAAKKAAEGAKEGAAAAS